MSEGILTKSGLRLLTRKGADDVAKLSRRLIAAVNAASPGSW